VSLREAARRRSNLDGKEPRLDVAYDAGFYIAVTSLTHAIYGTLPRSHERVMGRVLGGFAILTVEDTGDDGVW